MRKQLPPHSRVISLHVSRVTTLSWSCYGDAQTDPPGEGEREREGENREGERPIYSNTTHFIKSARVLLNDYLIATRAHEWVGVGFMCDRDPEPEPCDQTIPELLTQKKTAVL